MALANVAVLLAQRGSKVLVVDWDLEAPGIERYFEDMGPGVSEEVHGRDGIVEIVERMGRDGESRWTDSVIRLAVPGADSLLDFLSAGRRDSGYVERLQHLDWEALFSDHDFGSRLEIMRDEWLNEYDHILIDSRTGITDIGGICTIYLPDIIVAMFSANHQSVDGVADVISRARHARSGLPVDRGALVCIPVPARDETRTEYQQSLEWRNIYHGLFSELYLDFLPRDVSAEDALDLLRIPNIPFWSFGERLPVLAESVSDPNGISYFYSILARLLETDLSWRDSAPSQTSSPGGPVQVVRIREPQPAAGAVSGKGRGGALAGSYLNELAEAVESQWSDEYLARTFSDPTEGLRDIRASWAAASSPLAADWDEILKLAASAGPDLETRPSKWARSPRGLSGLDEEDFQEILEKVPTGWLVVLGAPGSGKTMLMIRTLRKIVQTRGGGDPVPVLLPMTSWDPKTDRLRTWLEKQLPVDYPGLSASVTVGGKRTTVIAMLLDDQKIIPVLDGLDEMPPAAGVEAINRLNEAFRDPDRPLRLIVTCRTQDYLKAVGDPREGWDPNPVAAAAHIELNALEPDQVSSYLTKRGKSARWTAVNMKLMEPGSPLAEALNTPRYASLASEIYNPSHHQYRDRPPDPRELANLPDVERVHNHLLDAFIPAMYAKEQPARDRRAADEDEGQLPAERFLMILADYLTNGREEPTRSLEWWDLKGLVPDWLAPAFVGVICGIATAVAAGTGTHVGVGIGVGLGTGMLIAIAIGLSAFRARRDWDRRRLSAKAFGKKYAKRHPGPGMTGGMIGAVIGGVAAGVAGMHHIGHQASLFGGVPEGLGIALGAGATTDFLGGLVGVAIGAFVGGYLAAVGLGLPAGLVNGLGVGVAVALVVDRIGRHKPSRTLPKWDARIGIGGGSVIGLAIGLIVWREEGATYGIVFGVLLAALAAAPFGLRHEDDDLRYVPSPGQSLARDAKAFRLTALSAGLAAGAAGFLGGSMTSILAVHARADVGLVVRDGLGIGIASGLVVGLTFGFYHAASPEFRIITWWLAIRGKAPWRFGRFLNQAHKKTVLRQSGATYQFRQIELQLRLAERFRAEQNEHSGVVAPHVDDAPTTPPVSP
jgi:hypothetical protein